MSGVTESVGDAIARLIEVAKGDLEPAGKVANFILAWANAKACGGFDMSDLFALDGALSDDITTVFSWLAMQTEPIYPWEFRSDLEEVMEKWRPEIWTRSRDPR